ncbi:MAG: DUF1178 family protein [Pseudomonadota bacterium]
MIRFALKCENDHRFESWFQSGTAFDALQERGMVTCPDCCSTHVAKDLMAPKVAAAPKAPAEVAPPQATPQPMITTPDPKLVEAVRELRDHVEKTSDYVGPNFAREARAMHVGDAPPRPIYGEVDKAEAKDLIDDGVPAVPLPFIPRQKTN